MKQLYQAKQLKKQLKKIQKISTTVIPIQEIPNLYEHTTKQLIIQFKNQST